MLLYKLYRLVLVLTVAVIGSCGSDTGDSGKYYTDNQAVKEGQEVLQKSLELLKQLQSGFEKLKNSQPTQAQSVIHSQIAIRDQINQVKQLMDTLQIRQWDPVALNERLIILKNETAVLHSLIQNGQEVMRGNAPTFGVWTSDEEQK